MGFYWFFAPRALIRSAMPLCESNYDGRHKQCETFSSLCPLKLRYVIFCPLCGTIRTDIEYARLTACDCCDREFKCSVEMPLPTFGTTSKAWIAPCDRVKNQARAEILRSGLTQFFQVKRQGGVGNRQTKKVLHVPLLNSTPHSPPRPVHRSDGRTRDRDHFPRAISTAPEVVFVAHHGLDGVDVNETKWYPSRWYSI